MKKNNGHRPSEVWAKTKLELARALGISRPTLDTYTTLPNFPAKGENGWPVEECRQCTESRTGRTEDIKRLQIEKLREEVLQAQMRTLREANEMLPIELVNLALAHLFISLRNILKDEDDDVRKRLTEKIEGIDMDAFIAGLRLQTGQTGNE